MAVVDFGPASGNAELFLGVPPTAGVEVHVGSPLTSALNPQPPSEQVNPVDPGIATNQQTLVRLNLNLGQTASVRFVNPA